MKKSFQSEYFVFARRSRPFIMIFLLTVVCLVNFLMAGVFWQVSVMLAPYLCTLVLGFMDYFVFCGFNSRKTKGIDILKSSARGRALVVSAVKQDAVNKSLFSLAACLFTLISILTINKEVDKFFVILYAIAAFSTCQVINRLLLLVDRWKGLTMQTHMFIVYLGYFAGGILLLPLIFLAEGCNVAIMAVYAVVAEALSVLSGIWLVKSCTKAYDSSFYDE